eukprot:Nk52_evm17s559 gene=Nk52_evmTU17s559
MAMKSILILMVICGFASVAYAKPSHNQTPKQAAAEKGGWVQSGCCDPSNSTCWPTTNDLEQLAVALEDGKVERTVYNGNAEDQLMAFQATQIMRPASEWSIEGITDIPMAPKMHNDQEISSTLSDNPMAKSLLGPYLKQPLVGRGRRMRAVYVQAEEHRNEDCDFNQVNVSDFCAMGMRNRPMSQSKPQIIAWPTKAEHVSTLVKFARKHNLCVAVVGMGHDYLNRHSNGNSLLIRTGLLKGTKFDDKKETVTVGAGVNDIEVSFEAFAHNRSVVHGWCATVGVAGFTVSGGEGVTTNNHGFAADNLVAAEIVTADGEIRTVNETSADSELWWALRGGGGGLGIMTSMTFKTYPNLPGVISLGKVPISVCNTADKKDFNEFAANFLKFQSNIPKKTNGQWEIKMIYDERLDAGSTQCLRFDFTFKYYKTADDTLDEFRTYMKGIHDILPNSMVSPTNNIEIFEKMIPHDIAVNIIEYFEAEGISPNYRSSVSRNSTIEGPNIEQQIQAQSAMLNKTTAYGGAFQKLIYDSLVDCTTLFNVTNEELLNTYAGKSKCMGMADLTLRLDVARNNGTTEFEKKSPLAPGVHQAVMDVFFKHDSIYELSNITLQNHANPVIPNWRERFWGSNYPRLLAAKQKYDPEHLFWCRQCVGSGPNEYPRAVAAHTGH